MELLSAHAYSMSTFTLSAMFEEYEPSIQWFLKTLSCDNPDKFTKHDWDLVRAYTKSDGCTGVIDLYIEACIEHDFLFRTHHDFSGKVISFYEANKRFRIRIQRLSKLGMCDPVSWWRWLAVCFLPQARRAWDEKQNCHG